MGMMDPSNSQHQVLMPINNSSSSSTSVEEVVLMNCSSKPREVVVQQQSIISSEKKGGAGITRSPQPAEQSLKCPRCDSSNTKFCYYNNYSLSQPRYFCKGCRRYWTQGGSIRNNVPVGGGCRKNTNKHKSSFSSSSSKNNTQDHHHHHHHHQIFAITNSNSNPISSVLIPTTTTTTTLPPLTYDSNDFTLAFSRLQKQPNTTMQLGFDHHHHHTTTDNNNLNNSSSGGFVDALRSGFLETQSGFHNNNFQYGFGNINYNEGGELEINQRGGGGGGGIDAYHEKEITSTTTTTTRREEDEFWKGSSSSSSSSGREINYVEDESKVFANFPWLITNTGDENMGNLDSSSSAGRSDYWINNGYGPSWHGLVNLATL